jgi:hypothetical protein
MAKAHHVPSDHTNGAVARPPPLHICKSDVQIECVNARCGLIAGVLVVLITIATVIQFHIANENGYHDTALYIYLASDIILILVTLAATVAVLRYMNSLGFVAKEKDTFDDKLLVLALGGFYFYSSFIILSSSRSLQAGTAPFASACFLIREVLAIIQISLQTVVILDGFRRRAETEEQVHKKPGRALVTFLLTCNFSLWIMNTFEIKRAEVSDIHVHVYSKLAWRLVVYFSLPLVIFYRFHSTVCLSDIWEKAYEKENDE